MKKMRKILSALLAMSMVFTLLAVSASAAAPDSAVSPAVDPAVPAAVRATAYMDIEKASPSQREAILAARRQIVYGDQAWTVDGAAAVLHADGTIEYLPEFSDLWPDWDLAEISGQTPDPYASLNTAKEGNTVHYDDVPLLPAQSGTRYAPTFYRFNANGNIVYTWMVSMDKVYLCNIGFNNEDTGEDITWRPGLKANEQLLLNTRSGVRYGVRASAAGATSANAHMVVSEDPKYIPVIQG